MLMLFCQQPSKEEKTEPFRSADDAQSLRKAEQTKKSITQVTQPTTHNAKPTTTTQKDKFGARVLPARSSHDQIAPKLNEEQPSQEPCKKNI
jgi:hypothetical protein